MPRRETIIAHPRKAAVTRALSRFRLEIEALQFVLAEQFGDDFRLDHHDYIY